MVQHTSTGTHIHRYITQYTHAHNTHSYNKHTHTHKLCRKRHCWYQKELTILPEGGEDKQTPVVGQCRGLCWEGEDKALPLLLHMPGSREQVEGVGWKEGEGGRERWGGWKEGEGGSEGEGGRRERGGGRGGGWKEGETERRVERGKEEGGWREGERGEITMLGLPDIHVHVEIQHHVCITSSPVQGFNHQVHRISHHPAKKWHVLLGESCKPPLCVKYCSCDRTVLLVRMFKCHLDDVTILVPLDLLRRGEDSFHPARQLFAVHSQ